MTNTAAAASSSLEEILQHFSPEVQFATPASRRLVGFKVEVLVSDPTGKEYEFQGIMDAPQGVIAAINNNKQNPQLPAVFRKLIFAIYPSVKDALMEQGPWHCHNCRNPATNFTTNFMSYLHIREPGTLPFIADTFCRPICSTNAAECRVRTERWCQDQLRQVRKMQDDKQVRKEMKKCNLNQYSCAKCFRKADKNAGIKLKTCKRCEHVWYCSKECQRKDWPKHKKNCIDVNLR